MLADTPAQSASAVAELDAFGDDAGSRDSAHVLSTDEQEYTQGFATGLIGMIHESNPPSS